jgi:hypothetical protein
VTPGFTERTFEFCYNAEYCRLNAALLATHPHIPSQRAEKDLGYDVEFKIRHGGFTCSLFIQHKVASFAEHRSGRGGPFWDAHGGPYFRFPVDTEQHNVLCELSREKGNTFYCSPKFHGRHELDTHYQADSVGTSAILLDPLDVAEIVDAERHNITYDPVGTVPVLHSEIRKFTRAFGGGKKNGPELKREPITLDYFDELSELLMRKTQDSRFRREISPELKRRRPVERAQHLLGRVYQVSWLLLP